MNKMRVFSAIVLLVSMGVVLLTGTTTVQAASSVQITDFSDWVSDSDGTGTPVTLTPADGNVTIAASGTSGETWGGLLTEIAADNATGMKATINISRVSGATGNASIGIMGSLGKIGKTQRILASIFHESINGKQTRIRWKIKSKTKSTSTVLATGTFADVYSSGYDIRTDVTIYFKRFDNTIVFGIEGTPYMVTWTSKKKMSAYDPCPELFGYAHSGANGITGVIKNVYVLY